MLAEGPKWFMADADQLPSPLITPLVIRTDPAGVVLKPPKTRRPAGQGGVVAVANLPIPMSAEAETSVSSGFLLRQQ